MIKRLRIQFVCAIMAIAALMLAGILGVVIHFTGSIMEMQSINMMRTIAESPTPRGNLREPSGEVRLPFFAVELSRHGELLSTSGGYFDLSDEADIQEMIDTAMSSRSETGELEEYHLRFLVSKSPRGYTIVFSDTASEMSTLENLFYSCLLIFFGAMVVFLGLSTALSHWVIKPVADAWNQQRQFVADASHELKTPLSVIMANAELLQGEDTGEEERRNFSKRILSTSYQMRSLVENMLEMARVDNGTVNMHFETVDFSQVVGDAVLSFQLLYEEKNMGLTSSIAEGILLSGSEHHLYQILDVLLDNALKYSTPESTVHVRVSRSGRNCILSVSGPGDPISKEDLKNIFKRFYRVDKARAMNGSYGLGLSIAKSLVTAHKGRIWAQSENGLNTFYVQLPTSAKS